VHPRPLQIGMSSAGGCGLGNGAISISCWAKMFRRRRLERQVLGILGRARTSGRRASDGGDDRKMNNEPFERERKPIERVRARLEALVMANATPRCGARSKRTGKPCRAAAMPNGRCKVHGGKSTGPRTPEGLERRRRASTATTRAKPKRNVRACGLPYWRCAICGSWHRLTHADIHDGPKQGSQGRRRPRRQRAGRRCRVRPPPVNSGAGRF
jgi:hypothetical protein